MEILIVGAGAMGGLFAALLTPHAAVTLLTTNQEHAGAIEAHGLALTALDGATQHVQVRVRTDPRRCEGQADLVLICTKAGATGAAARSAGDLLAPDGLVLTLQNGLGNLEQIEAEVGPARAAAGVTAQAATLLGPGQVHHAGCGPTAIGVRTGQERRLEAVAALFNRAGIDTSLSDDVDSLLWSKLVVNVGINALTALMRVPNGVLARYPTCEGLMADAVVEAVAVARSLGIAMDEEQQLARVRQVCTLTAANRSSMLQDILRGTATEIEVINGAVVARGLATGIPTPVNSLLTRLVKALEATASDRI